MGHMVPQQEGGRPRDEDQGGLERHEAGDGDHLARVRAAAPRGRGHHTPRDSGDDEQDRQDAQGVQPQRLTGAP